MDSSTPVDVQRLAQTVESMEKRLTALETLAGVKPAPVEPTHEPAPVSPVEPKPEPVPVPPVEPSHEPAPVPPVEPKPEPTPVPPVEPKPEPTPVPPVEPKPEPIPVPPVRRKPKPTPEPKPEGSFEFKFGTQGALYAGLLLLLIGMASLVAWGYQYMGPAFKIGAGLVVSLAMVAGGELIARKRQNMKWYGMGLIGGGYALGYFLLYAMQNIASVKILDNVLVDSCLLLAWAGGGIAHSLVRKSEEIALLSTLLAFVTISLSPLGFFSVGASAILSVALATVVVRMDWLKVYLLGAIGSYATYLVFTQPQIQAVQGDTPAGFWLSGAFLGVFWLVYNAVAFLLKPSDDKSPARRYTILAVLALNAVGFVVPSLYSMGTFLPEWRWLFLSVTGVAYFGMTRLASLRGLREVSTLALLLGLQLVTAAVPLKLDSQAVSAVWLLEVACLVAAGLRFNLLPFRWFAVALAAVTAGRLVLVDLANPHTFSLFGQAIDWRWLIGSVAVASYGVAAWCYRSTRFELAKTSYEKLAGYPLYFILAAAAAWTVPAMVAPVGFKALFWAIEAMALVLLGIKLTGPAHSGAKDSEEQPEACRGGSGSHPLDARRASGTSPERLKQDALAQELASLAFLTSAVSLAVNYAAINTVVVCVVVGLFYLASFAFKWAAASLDPAKRRSRHHLYVVSAVVLTLLMTGLRGYLDPLSLALRWTIECGMIVLLGFQLKDTAIRRLGTLGFAPVAIALIASLPAWTWAGVLPVVAVLFGLHIRFRLGCPADDKTTDTWLDQLGQYLGGDENEYVKRIYFVLGSVALAACFGLLLEPARLPLVWSCQFAVTVGAGFVLRERYLRLIGAAGFVTTGVALAATTTLWSWASILPVVGIVLALHAWYRLGCPEDKDGATELDRQISLLLGENESVIFRIAYMVAGSLALGAAFGVLLDAKWLALAWACQSVVGISAGFQLKDTSYRQLGTAGMALVGLTLFATRALWMWSTVLPVVAMVFALYYVYSSLLRAKQSGKPGWLASLLPGVQETLSETAETVCKAYALATIVLLTACFAQLLDSRILAVAWSLEGLTLVALGFALGEKIFRQGGLVVLSLLTLKLLFIDLSGAETIQRILSFIVAGVVWLAVSFGYGWLNKKLDGNQEKPGEEALPKAVDSGPQE